MELQSTTLGLNVEILLRLELPDADLKIQVLPENMASSASSVDCGLYGILGLHCGVPRRDGESRRFLPRTPTFWQRGFHYVFSC